MAEDGRRIAILGGGKIGESLLSGLLSSGWRKPEEIVVSGRRQERIDELAERYGVETTLSNAQTAAIPRPRPFGNGVPQPLLAAASSRTCLMRR